MDEFDVLWLKRKVLRSAWQFKSVEVAEVWLVEGLHVFEVEIADGTESVRETVKFVAGQELLMKVQVLCSMTNNALLIL